MSPRIFLRRPAAGAAVLVLFGFLSAAASLSAQVRDEGQIRQTATAFREALGSEDWPRAIELGRKLVELSPTNHVHPYNLACVYALAGDREEALAWLERAAGEGFSNPEGMAADEDLRSLRQEPRFAAALERVRENHETARKLFRQLAEGSEAVIYGPEDGPEGGKAEPRLPVLVVLHGYGHSTDRFAESFEALARRNDLIVIAPRSVIPTPNGGYEWGTGEDTLYQVQNALKQAEQTFSLDHQRLYLLGFSQGGHMAQEILAGGQLSFQGTILIGARIQKPFADGDPPDGTPPLFLMAGREEPAADSNRAAAKALKKAGHPVQVRIYPGVGHSFPSNWQGEIRKALRWFGKRVDSTEGPG